MAGPLDFTGQNIQNTYQRVLQTDGVSVYDGTGSLFSLPTTPTGSLATTGSNIFIGNQTLTGSIFISSSNFLRFNHTGSGTNTNYSDLSIIRYPTYDTPALRVVRPDGIGFTLYRQGSANNFWVGDENGNRNMTLYSNAMGAFTFNAPGSGGDFQFTGGDATTPAYASSIVFKTIDNTVNAATSSDHSVKILGPNVTGSNPYNLVSFQVGSTFAEKAAIRYDGGAYFSSSVGIATGSTEAFLFVKNIQDISGAGGARTAIFEHRFGVNALPQTQRFGVIVRAAPGDGSTAFGISNQAYNSMLQGYDYVSGVYKGISLSPLGGSVSVGRNLAGTADDVAKFVVRGSGTTSATTTMRIENTNGSASMVVLDDGSVGIGTTTPTQKLEIVGGHVKLGANYVVYTNTVASANASNTNLNLNGTTSATLGLHNASMPFVITVTGGSEIMRISGSGNVGIGTSTPGAKLDVAGTTYLRGVALDSIFGYTGNNITYINAGYTSFQGNIGVGGLVVPSAQLHISGSPSQVLLIASSSTGPALYVSGSGNIGIGTNAPTAKLDVSGNARITNGLIISSSTTINDQLVINIPELDGPIDRTAPAGFYKATVNGAVVYLPYYL